MSKKFLLVLLCLCTVLSLFACSKNSSKQSAGVNDPNKLKDNGNNYNSLIEEDTPLTPQGILENGSIQKVTPYSNGYLLVNKGNECYCINKEGGILFKIPANHKDIKDIDARTQFYKGHALLIGQFNSGGTFYAICDNSGKLTMPQDVGVLNFHKDTHHTLENGYILSVINEGNLKENKYTLGVMNTKFEWIISPTEELYNLFDQKTHSDDFMVGDSYIFTEQSKSIDFKTGEIKNVDLKTVTPSSQWIITDDGFNAGTNGVLSIKKFQFPGSIICSTKFHNGAAAILYDNTDTGKSNVALINEKGEFIHKPIEIDGAFDVASDGTCMAVMYSKNDQFYIVTIDKNGKQSQALKVDRTMFDLYVNDGVLAVHSYTLGEPTTLTLYDYNLNQLY